MSHLKRNNNLVVYSLSLSRVHQFGFINLVQMPSDTLSKVVVMKLMAYHDIVEGYLELSPS